MDEDYIPQPFPKDFIDPLEWMYVLVTIATCALPMQTKLCDEDRYDM